MEDLIDDTILFILTYKRPDNQITLRNLQKLGYRGRVLLVVSDNDPELDRYIENYGDMVYVFNKEKAVEELGIDLGNNFNEYDGILVPRGYCFKIAKELGYPFFIEFDDDYRYFAYRYEENSKLKTIEDLPCFTEIINAYVNFLKKTNVDTIAFAQGGDYIGGTESSMFKEKISRKAMNGFFLRTDKYLEFKGILNEDVNCYVTNGMRGKILITPCEISLGQMETQSQTGGLTDTYSGNTYVKSFYSVMYSPSNVKISAMGVNKYRIHHKVLKNQTYPKILHEKHRAKQIEN